jgi:hypothetical protein
VRIDKDNNIYSVKLHTKEYVRRRHFPLTVRQVIWITICLSQYTGGNAKAREVDF